MNAACAPAPGAFRNWPQRNRVPMAALAGRPERVRREDALGRTSLPLIANDALAGVGAGDAGEFAYERSRRRPAVHRRQLSGKMICASKSCPTNG